jgi:serine/threonine-protein kinase
VGDRRDEETMPRVGLVPTDEPEGAGIPRAGDVIAEKYRVERILGVGGMGVVFAVTHLQLGEPYAIKCLLPRAAADPEAIERFMREARAAVRIKSEHIARVSDVGQLANGSPYILMEYLTGRDLSDVLRERGSLSIHDAVEYVLQACTGIAEAHALGIVHRDLKPSNLFLTQRLDGASLVKVLDFGISKATADSAPHKPSLTQTASVFGSPAYMSPEQIRSAKNVDFRTDVWALGVILYELLAGQTPFVAETSGGLLSAIAADEPPRMRERRPDVSEELEAVVSRCLEKKVQNRFQSVSAMASALEPFRGAGSLVSVGRIRRLSAAPSARDVSVAVAPSAGQGVVDVGAATDKAWTAATRRPKAGRAVVLLVAASVVVPLAIGALYVVRRAGSVSSTDAPARGPSAVAVESPVPASSSAPHDVVVGPNPPVDPAPSTTPSATAKAPTSRPARASAPAQPVDRAASSATSITSRAPRNPPSEGPAPSATNPGGQPLDPFGSSH